MVGRTLHIGLAAQRIDAAAGDAHIPEQSWIMDMVRMIWLPVVCWVQPMA